MNKSKSITTKTCIICHREKPLSAFLIIAGAQLYGNICASCRSEAHAHPPINKETEETSKSDSGKKIDSKTKVVTEKDKREQRKELEEKYYEEREESGKKELEKTQKKSQQAELQTRHRKDFLEKRTFLQSDKISPQEVDAQLQQEALEKTINTSAPFIDASIPGKLKYSGESFKKFANWVGESSAIGKAFKQQQKTSSTKTSSEKSSTPTTITEDAKNKWRPKSR